MSELVESAASELRRYVPDGFGDPIEIRIEGFGSILVDQEGVRPGTGPACCVISARPDIFLSILRGSLSATNAIMSGDLRVMGDLRVASRFAQQLR